MAGFRGGYKPFYNAVAELTRRGVFDATEISGGAHVTESKVGIRDEYYIPFPDGMYDACTYRRVGDDIIIADDSISGLHVERFTVDPGQYAPFDDTGICRLEIRYGGRYTQIRTGNPRHGQQFTVRAGRTGNNGGTNRRPVRTTPPEASPKATGGRDVDNDRPPRRYQLSEQYKANRRS